MDGGATGNQGICGNTTSGDATDTTDVLLSDCPGTPAADYMEMYSVEGAEPGDIVAVGNSYAITKDGDRLAKLTKSVKPYQQNIIGVVSNPEDAGDFNSIGRNIKEEDNPMPVALSGRVKVKVSIENGIISTGDYLTSSSKPGVAMKATTSGRVIGIALESFNNPSIGKVMMFVNLHENLAPRLNELSEEIQEQQYQIEQLKQEIEELKPK